MTGSVYPLRPDWQAYAAELAPSVLRRGLTWPTVLSLVLPMGQLDQQAVEIVRVMDPTIAGGAWLDYCGARVGEYRGGLGDTEYRRIILGRTAANWARGRTEGVWACWLALTGATPDRARIYPVPASGKPCVYLEGEIGFTPTGPFLQRAAAVITSATIGSYDVSAHMYPGGAARPGRFPGGGSAVGAWTLPTT